MAVTGDFSAAWKVKLLIAASARWATLCGADDPADHIAIYYGDDDPAAAPFPRCIINDTAEGGTMAWRRSALGVWQREGTIHAVFEIEVPSGIATTLEDEGNWFVSQTGQIAREIRQLVTAKTLIGGEYPIELSQIAPIEGPARLSAEEREQFVPAEGASQLPLWIQTLELTLVP